MAIKDYLDEIEEKHNQEMEQKNYLDSVLPEARKAAVEMVAKEYYDEMCKTIASGISKNNQAYLQDDIYIHNSIKIDIPSINYITTETLFDFEYKFHSWRGYYECRMHYKNSQLLDMLFSEISKLCKEDGIALDPFCIYIENYHFEHKHDRYALDSTFKIKYVAQIGGGHPKARPSVLLHYSYARNA